jgi:hypothetical protein
LADQRPRPIAGEGHADTHRTADHDCHEAAQIEYTKFWSSLFREFGVFDASCCKKNGCQKSKQCKEFIAKERGSTAMPDAIGMLQKKVDTQLARYVSGNHELEWNKIGKLVFDWCCGNTPIPSIG